MIAAVVVLVVILVVAVYLISWQYLGLCVIVTISENKRNANANRANRQIGQIPQLTS